MPRISLPAPRRALLPLLAFGLAVGCGGAAPEDPLREIFAPLAGERWYLPLLSAYVADPSCAAESLAQPCDPRLPERAVIHGREVRRRILGLAPDSPLRRRAIGTWHLLWADTEDSVDAGVRQLAQAARFSHEPDVWSDLAAAHLLHGARRGGALGWVKALRAADTALALAPAHPAALFNRQLALRELRLPGDPLPEAREAAGSAPVPALDRAADALARLAADPTACPDLAADARQAAAPERRGDDRLLPDLASWLEADGCERLKEPGAPLLDALADLATGIDRYQRHRDAEALAPLERAAERFGAAPPVAALARFYVAATLRRLNRHAAARRRLEALAGEATRHGYSQLVVRAEWLLGTTVYFLGDLARSNAHYRAALEEAERIGDRRASAGLAGLLSEGLAEAGRLAEALDLGLTGIDRALAAGDAAVLGTAYGQAASTALDLDEPRLAALYYGAAIPWAERAERPIERLRLHLWRGLTRAEIGELGAAEEDLERAGQLLAELPEGAERQRRAADLELATAHVHRRADPQLAASLAGRASAFYAQHGPAPFQAWSSIVGGEALLALGRREEAEATYRRALALQEEFGAGISVGEIAFLRSYSGYDRLIELLLLEQRSPLEALAISERSRLFDGVLRRVGTPPGGRAAPRLPAGRKVLAYHLLDGRQILGWVLGPDGVADFFRSEPEEIEPFAELLLPAASPDGEAFREASGRLYDLLIRPAEQALDPGDELVIVPDKVLRSVPFAGLWDRATGSYLVERHAVTIAPLLGDGLAVPAERGESSTPPGSALIVANPAFAAERHPRLPRLPYSELEAAAAQASLSRGVRILRGEAATLPALTAALGEARLLHFAGHAIDAPGSPGRAALLLAPATTDDAGLLDADRLRALPLAGLGLVVLSACDTSGERDGSGTPLGLVGAFLDGGVPAVVGTLAPLGDRFFTRFFTAFYERLGQGDPVVAALRAVQLRELRSQSPTDSGPPLWAFVQVYVGPQDAPADRRERDSHEHS